MIDEITTANVKMEENIRDSARRACRAEGHNTRPSQSGAQTGRARATDQTHAGLRPSLHIA